MEATILPRVKICCIGSREEAWFAIRSGAAAVGLVSKMPGGPGIISDALAAEIAAVIPPGVASVLLTSRQSAAGIIEQQRKIKVNTIQICDSFPADSYGELRRALPGIALVQVIHITGAGAIDAARAAAPHINALLLDSGNPSLPVKELGGTGRSHDWQISRAIRKEVAVPVYLAGGLNAGNVAEAIALVRPFGVDVCSGVRTDGRLDAGKLAAFFKAVKAGA